MSIKDKIDELFNVDVDAILNEEGVTMDNLLDPIITGAEKASDGEVDAFTLDDEYDEGIPVYDSEDETMHFILDMDEVLERLRKARERQEIDLLSHEDSTLPKSIFGDLVTDLEELEAYEEGELKEDRVPTRTLAQLIKKKKLAYKKKKEKIKKMGVAKFRKQQIIAKKKRRLKKVELKRKRNLYLKSAKGKRSQKIAKKRQAALKSKLKGKSISDLVKIPKIGGILGRAGTSGAK